MLPGVVAGGEGAVESGEAGDEVLLGRGGSAGRAEEERRRHEGEEERGGGGHGGDELVVGPGEE